MCGWERDYFVVVFGVVVDVRVSDTFEETTQAQARASSFTCLMPGG